MVVPFYDQVVSGNAANRDFSGHNFTDTEEENKRMLASCRAAADNNVLVYTIGFEISVNGTAEKALRNCASSISHYYTAQGTEISEVFASIAASIQKLKLLN